MAEPDVGSRTVWTPYDDEPLFCPELAIGVRALDAVRVERLRTYLRELVLSRAIPIAVPVAFNGIYFGYDLVQGGYVGGPLELDDFPVVAMGDRVDALPVGAMVNVATGSDPLYAEVVYKEGAHSAVDETGAVPAWLSGAPASADPDADEHEGAVLAERWVCDFGAFGAGLAVGSRRLARFRVQGRWLDARGHLVLSARYPDAAAAEQDDTSFFARYLAGAARDRLLSPAAPQPLRFMLADDCTDGELEQLVLGCLATIKELLSSIPDVVMWGPYAFSRAALRRRLAEDGPLGGADLRSVAAGLCRVPSERRRFASAARPAVYTAVGPRLAALSGAARELTGLRYPLAICHANAVITEHVTRAASNGVLPSGAHVRLDDPWQHGGIWRGECPAGPYAAVDPRQPLGLGWLGTLGQPEPVAPGDGTDAAAEEAGFATVLSDGAHGVSWSVALRLSHLLMGRCPIPAVAAEAMRRAGLVGRAVTLALRHEGERLAVEELTQSVIADLTPKGRGGHLDQVRWPASFRPGLVLTLTWARGGVVHARTTRLERPVRVDGQRFDHVYDPRIVTRDLAPGDPARGSAETSLALDERVLRAIRKLGLLTVDGWAVFEEARLPVAVYGASARPGSARALAPVVDRLLRAGVLGRDSAVRADGWLRWPARGWAGPRIRVLVWRPPIVGVDADDDSGMLPVPRVMRRQTVAPHLRRIAGEPSEAAREAYRQLILYYGMAVDPELPPGYTLVREHERGGRTVGRQF